MKLTTPDVLVEALYDHIEEVWFTHDFPLFGVAVVNDQKFVFNAYSETAEGLPLYLYATITEGKLEEVLAGRLPVLEIYTNPDVLLWKETPVQEGGLVPSLVEVEIVDLNQNELPLAGVYLNS